MNNSILNLKNLKKINSNKKVKDFQLFIFVMGIAACGLIYQYLLASYSGRVIGSMEIVIFSIMTLMILFMGIGSFIVKYFDNKFLAFSILESIIAVTAVSSIYVISGANAVSQLLPEIISETFGIPFEYSPSYGIVENIQSFLDSSSFIMACILGFFLGMEIPFLAAIREELHNEEKLNNNIGVIYGVDYFGAAFGAGLWIFILIQMDISIVLKYVSFVNVFVGFFFIVFFKSYIKKIRLAFAVQIITGLFIVFACNHISSWQNMLEQSFYRDKIVYAKNTKFQRFTVTEGFNYETRENIYSLYINGRTQFQSSDEGLYHSLLVYPTLTAAHNPKDILIIGGGDGLALRDVLKFNPEHVTLMDLDPELVEFFKNPVYSEDGKNINASFIDITEGSFKDERVEFLFGDAYINTKKLMQKGRKFDAIIVDLPDPSHPDLNKLYSKSFYMNLNQMLNHNGAISIQSSSPYSSKEAFISIGKTLNASGFNTQQYQHIIPSFNGQWGWTIGTKSLPMPKARIASYEKLPIKDEWLTKEKLLSTFVFGAEYYKESRLHEIKVNTIDNNATYQYYEKAWNEMSKSAFE